MDKRVTMKEVAAAAGVSPSTVCRSLNGHSQIPGATREKVRRIAATLGYRPDPLLSAFARRRRGSGPVEGATTIAYLTDFASPGEWDNHPFDRRIFEGASAQAREFGYALEPVWLKEPGMDGGRLSRVLYHRGISAVCIAPTLEVRDHLPLEWQRFHGVAIGNLLLRPGLHRAASHHFHGIQMAVRELRRAGYRRIGFCASARTSKRVDHLWLAGMFLGREIEPRLRLSTFLFKAASRGDIPDWCRREKLEVVIGAEPLVLETLRRAGLFPAQVDYASVNWTPADPKIGGIDQRPERIGAAAIELLTRQAQRGDLGVPEVPVTTLVEGRWVWGSSLRRR